MKRDHLIWSACSMYESVTFRCLSFQSTVFSICTTYSNNDNRIEILLQNSSAKQRIHSFSSWVHSGRTECLQKHNSHQNQRMEIVCIQFNLLQNPTCQTSYLASHQRYFNIFLSFDNFTTCQIGYEYNFDSP